ncbi:hypothetical protein BpHYR1_043512 [Brachionus plicatilis]|uniref:Uncharacterized protein n=1 Tax=Brachionus plicatilis TaxID=10195 RepID=A0A3M7RKF0_BRAPC|nr:hypothetical protein BpHYR1_043512 [Brachionus plicatilis]
MFDLFNHLSINSFYQVQRSILLAVVTSCFAAGRDKSKISVLQFLYGLIILSEKSKKNENKKIVSCNNVAKKII